MAGDPGGLGVDTWPKDGHLCRGLCLAEGKGALIHAGQGQKRHLDLCKQHPAWHSPCTLLNNLLLLGVTYHFPAPSTSMPSCGGGLIGPAPQGASFPRRKGALALFRCLSPLPPLPSTSVLAYVMFFPYKFHLAALCSQTIR